MKPKVAMIFGILGGMFGLLIGLYGYSLMAVAVSSGMRDAGLIQMISIATPIASFVGGFVVTTNPGTAGTLMILSAAAMAWVFGWNAFTAVPLFLSAIGGCLALDIAINTKRATRASQPGRVEPLRPERAVDDGQSQLPLKEDADQTGAAASSVSPAYYAARRHEPARRPPLEDRSFELAKLAVAGVVALAAITAAGVLGWKYLEQRPREIVHEVVKEVPKEVIREVVKEVPREIVREVVREAPTAAPAATPSGSIRQAEREVSPPMAEPQSAPIEQAQPSTPAPRPETKSRTAAVAPVQSFRGEPANWYQSIVGCCIAYCQLIECNSPSLPKACSPEIIAMNYYPGATAASAKRNYLVGAETIFDDVDLPECR